jgi:hypothetical protein
MPAARTLSRRVSAIMVAISTLCLFGCLSAAQEDRDTICSEIAAFANASTDLDVHVVELGNDWGCNFQKPENSEELWMACKTCTHGTYVPAEKLCGYLIKNTSTEFPAHNFSRALACLDTGYHVSPNSRESVERLSNRTIWSSHAKLTNAGIVVGVEYIINVKDSPEILRISVRRRRS